MIRKGLVVRTKVFQPLGIVFVWLSLPALSLEFISKHAHALPFLSCPFHVLLISFEEKYLHLCCRYHYMSI